MENLGIIILTNGMRRAPLSKIGWKPDLAAHMRVVAGARVYRERKESGHNPYFLISGGKINGKDNPSLSSILSPVANRYGVSTKDLLLEEDSIDTTENAEFSMRLIKEKGLINKLHIVTSNYHLPRSVAAFERYGGNVEKGISAEEILRSLSRRHKDFVRKYERDCDLQRTYLRNKLLYLAFRVAGPNLLRKLAHRELENKGERFVPSK